MFYSCFRVQPTYGRRGPARPAQVLLQLQSQVKTLAALSLLSHVRPVYRQCLYPLQTCVSNILSSTNEIQAEGSAEVPNADDRLVGISLH